MLTFNLVQHGCENLEPRTLSQKVTLFAGRMCLSGSGPDPVTFAKKSQTLLKIVTCLHCKQDTLTKNQDYCLLDPKILIFIIFSTRECSSFSDNVPRPLLWAGSLVARAKFTVSGVHIRLN
jgi:hypothetical protein